MGYRAAERKHLGLRESIPNTVRVRPISRRWRCTKNKRQVGVKGFEMEGVNGSESHLIVVRCQVEQIHPRGTVPVATPVGRDALRCVRG